jgi:DNA-3-methyladenine glycosylase II
MSSSNPPIIVTIETDRDIADAVSVLMDLEPRFAPVVQSAGPPPLRRMETGLPGLLRIVNDQVLSLKSAARIWERLAHALDPLDAPTILARDELALMQLGLSRAKARAFLAIAAGVSSGDLPIDDLATFDDQAAYAALLKVRGIGPWTAEIYLLSCLGRADIWPAGDLALQLAVQSLFGLDGRPSEKDMRSLAEPWRPRRAVAARLLWSHYRTLKGMAQTVG